MKRAIMLILLCTKPAIAQVSSTTNCIAGIGMATCRTEADRSSGGLGAFMEGYMDAVRKQREAAEAAARLRAAQAEALAAEQANANENNRAYIRRRAGELAASGDCFNAKQIAVQNGEFQLHKEIVDFCGR